ncbi:hypothetical protein IQ264_12425 [Phormidium sp. LEGE 05292]|uniref:hypothetical protein n=1 Tax=[Phormidium] sp. LEGE 05292 TaxID=767427 RepID=UPI00187EAE20|nr:hypothetical protein [Phormidium sp. LEGE 05292]MBE9226230.1 hypothetical protein [Phormidium sp. LEGE 05292]
MSLEILAAKIVEIAFGKLVETVFGKGIEAGLAKVEPLRKKIWNKLKGNSEAKAALIEVEKNPSQPNIAQVAKFLDEAMVRDAVFAKEIQAIAQQINQEINLSTTEDKWKIQIIRDNAKGYQVENVKADNVQFGDVHHHH